MVACNVHRIIVSLPPSHQCAAHIPPTLRIVRLIVLYPLHFFLAPLLAFQIDARPFLLSPSSLLAATSAPQWDKLPSPQHLDDVSIVDAATVWSLS